MIRSTLLALLVFFAPLALAQSAQEVLRDALSRYEADVAGVENYTLTQSVFGTETVVYAERTGDEASPFRFYSVTPDGLTELGDGGGTAMSPYFLFGRLTDQARYAGTETVDGAATHAVAVDDFGALARDLDLLPADAGNEFEIETATFYFGTDDHRPHQMTMVGTVTGEGRTAPVTVEVRFLEYRTVDGLTVPFRTRMTMTGMAGTLDPAEREETRRQLDEALRQMESMPAEQQAMMERMMGDQLDRLREMLAGDDLAFETEVTDVQVNAGRPSPAR